MFNLVIWIVAPKPKSCGPPSSSAIQQALDTLSVLLCHFSCNHICHLSLDSRQSSGSFSQDTAHITRPYLILLHTCALTATTVCVGPGLLHCNQPHLLHLCFPHDCLTSSTCVLITVCFLVCKYSTHTVFVAGLLTQSSVFLCQSESQSKFYLFILHLLLQVCIYRQFRHSANYLCSTFVLHVRPRSDWRLLFPVFFYLPRNSKCCGSIYG